MKKTSATFFLSLLTSISFAQPVFDSQVTPELIEAAQSISIEGVVEIPVQSIKAVESEGQIRYLSQNGRFAFEGQLIDVMQRKPLDTLDQIHDAVTRLDIASLGIDLEALNSVSFGQGDERVTAFIDPNCPPCLEVIKQAQSLQNDYRFTFIVVPASGSESSNQLSKKVHCALNKDDVIPALLSKKMSRLKTRSDCNPSVYDMTLLFTDMAGVNGVPFLISPTGYILRGQPIDMKTWLADPSYN